MIKQILKVLMSDNFYNGGKCIEIAKGKYELPDNKKIMKRKIKRAWQ